MLGVLRAAPGAQALPGMPQAGRAEAELARRRLPEVLRSSGYRGRTGIYELLEIDERSAPPIHDRASEHELRERAFAHGFRPLRRTASAGCATGVTTPEELLRVTRER